MSGNESTGQIVLTVAGTVIGAAAGNPTLGYTLGSMAGAAIFPPELPDGPRIADFNLSTSTYGSAIPVNYGTNRLPGNLIWADEVIHTGESVSVGKKATQNVDAVTQSFSMSFCKGEGTLLRLWMDNKIIFDIGRGPLLNGGINLDDIIAVQVAEQILQDFGGVGAQLTPYLQFKFYSGSETQERDPTMIAAYDRVNGSGGEENTPAHRGLCHIVFQNIRLAPWGNRIPTVTAEISSNASDSFPKTPWTVAQASPLESVELEEVGWDKARGFVYEHDATGSETGIRVFTYPGMVETNWFRDSEIRCGIPPYKLRGVSPRGYLYLDMYEDEGTPLWLLDPDTLKRAGVLPIEMSGSPTEYLEARYLGFVEDRFGQIFAVVCGGTNNRLAVVQEKYIVNPVSGIDAVCFTDYLPEQRVVGACEGVKLEGWTEFAVLAQTGTTDLTIYFGKIFSGFNIYTDVGSGGTGSGQSTCTIEVNSTFILATEFPSLYSGSPISINVRMVGFDPASNAVILLVENLNVGYYLCSYSVRGQNFNYKQFVPVVGNAAYNPPYNISDLSGRTFAVGKGSGVGSPQSGAFFLHGISAGEVVSQFPFSRYPAVTDVRGAQQFYDSKLQAIYVSDDQEGNTPGLHYAGRLGDDAIALSEIVAHISENCRLEPAQYDVSQLTDLVHGYPVMATANGRGMLEPLMAAYDFDPVETDYLVRFVKRGGAVVRTIPQDDLAGMDAHNNPVTQTRLQEVDLPEAIFISFIDYTRNYQKGTQSSRRIALPSPSQYSRSILNVELPIAMSPSKAKRIAETKLYQAWAGRDGFNLKTGWKYLALDPADVVDLEVDDDNTMRLRLGSANIGADYSCEFNGQTDDPTTYDPTAFEVAGALGTGESVLGGLGTGVQSITLDATLLNDYDDGGGNLTKYYQALKPLQPDQFSGGGLLRSNDGNTYATRATFTTAPPQGKLISRLDEELSPFTIYQDAYFDVLMHYGEAPISVSEIDFMAGVNSVAVQRSDGEVEWIQFRDVYDLGDRRIRCQYLLRGRRGSEVFTAGHAIGDRVVFFNAGTENSGIGMDNLDIGSIGRAMFFAGGAPGQTLAEVNKEVNTISGNDLKPYAPVQLTATRVGSPGDYVLTWVRRARLGGEWRDGTGTVPLAEASEAYEVDVYDVDANVLRTLTSSSPTVTYTYAQAVEDFGTPPAAADLSWGVAQMSASVGRGFMATIPPGILVEEVEEDDEVGNISIDDDQVIWLCTTGSQQRTICNDGDGPVTIASIALATGTHFVLSDLPTFPYELLPDEPLTITITLLTDSPAVKTDTVVITSDAADSPHEISLTAVGCVAAPSIVVSPDPIVFEPTPGNGCCCDLQVVTIFNNGNTTETIDDVGVDVIGSPPLYRVDPPFDGPVVLQPGEYTAAILKFCPAAGAVGGPNPASAYVDASTGLITVPMTGTAICNNPVIIASTGTLSFGDVKKSAPISKIVTFTFIDVGCPNSGTIPITSLDFNVPVPFTFSVLSRVAGSCYGTGTVTVNVQFPNTLDPGDYTRTLSSQHPVCGGGPDVAGPSVTVIGTIIPEDP